MTAACCTEIHEKQASDGDRAQPVLARSLSHLLEVIDRLEAKGAFFRSIQDPIDTASPQGKFTLQVLGAAAEFERALIRERTKAALVSARAAGRVGGKPNGKPGKRRVLVTRAWDRGIDLDDDQKRDVADLIAKLGRSMASNDGTSDREIIRLCEKALRDECLARGSKLRPRVLASVCKLNTKWCAGIDTDQARLNYLRKNDHKAWQDKCVNRVRRALHHQPMGLLIGDVHYVDMLVTEAMQSGRSDLMCEGAAAQSAGRETIRVRLIAWMDAASLFAWVTVPSSTREEAYGWLGQFPQLREWIGDRVVKDIKAHGFTITNKKFESTVSIKREDYADDRYGVFGSMFREMGHQAKVHPDELIFGLLAQGETTLCYDGQNFFDTDHPSVDKDGDAVTVSNILVPLGTDTPWYLFDTSRPIKPMIWQEREDYEFQMVNNHNDTGVFMKDLYHYGVRARVNAGFGLWHMAFMCKGPLNAANYKAARAAMMELRGDQGRVLGLKPDTLVVPPSLEEAARQIAVAQFDGAGASNVWAGTASVIVTPQLA